MVEVHEIRELARSISLLKMKEFMDDKSYSHIVEKVKLFTPIRGIFITSYFFSEPSIKLCEKCGIIPLDIIDILYLLFIGIQENIIKWSSTVSCEHLGPVHSYSSSSFLASCLSFLFIVLH